MGVGGLILLAVLFLGVVMLSNVGLRGMRLDLTQNKLYTLSSGTQAGAARTERTGQSVFLLFARCRGQTVAADSSLCNPRARIPGRNRGARRRQNSSARDRSAAFLRRGRPGRGIRPAGAAGGQYRRVAVFRPGGHQLDRWPLRHPQLPARSRGIPGIRRGKAHPRTRRRRKSR